MSDKVTQLYDGDGFNIKPGCTMKFGCCDCGLVHKLSFTINDDGNIGLVIKGDENSTVEERKRKNITIKRGEG